MQNLKILYLTTTPIVAGGANVLLAAAEKLFKDNFDIFLLTQEEGELTDRFSKIGGKVFIQKLPAWRKGKYFALRYLAIYRLAKIVKRNKINLIYSNNYRINPYALHVSKLCKIPFVTHVHDFLKKKHVYNFLLHKTQNLIVPSDYVYSCLNGIRGKINIFKVPNGIQSDKFNIETKGKIRKEFKIDSETILITMVAHFVERKGHKMLVEAVSCFKDRLGKAKFIMVGDNVYGSYLSTEDLKRFTQEKEVEPYFIFTGKRNDIPEIFADSDIFVFSSQDEPFGLAVIEVMAAKLPVIADVNSGGPAEIIKDNNCGMLINFSDKSAVAEVILKLIKNDSLRKKLGELGCKEVREKYDVSVFKKNMQEALKKIVGGNQGERKEIFSAGNV